LAILKLRQENNCQSQERGKNGGSGACYGSLWPHREGIQGDKSAEDLLTNLETQNYDRRREVSLVDNPREMSAL
jgi:hypothetical protein